MSNIRVSVAWNQPAVFAGEDINCVITFKNIAQVPNSKRTASQICNHNSPRERWKGTTTAHRRHQAPDHSIHHTSDTTLEKDRRWITSRHSAWNITSKTSKPSGGKDAYNEQSATSPRHRRSVSIVSIGSDRPASEKPVHAISTPRRPGQGHSRAASLQALPGRHTVSNQSSTAGNHVKGSSFNAKRYSQPSAHDHAATVPVLRRCSTSSSKNDKASSHALWSPNIPATEPNSPIPPYWRPIPSTTDLPQLALNASSPSSPSKQPSSVSTDDRGISPAPTQSTRQHQARGHLPGVISHVGNNGTLRSSTELYSASNNSSDTLASEYVTQESGRFPHHPVVTRQQFHHVPPMGSQLPETLMMGYGNIVGSFQLDASLVNAGYFDEVKKKAVIGNQGGGGVVRAESTKRQSGLLGSLGWNALGESLDGLLGGNEVSSIKETTSASAARWMPVLSTPQSLLFVDLRLEPGQSQSYSYSFRLPTGLPPTYRGKAVKFSYNLVIGVQRAARSRQRHTVRHVDFPFRVLPGVKGQGETMSHDLLSPHVMLHNEPSISVVNEDQKREPAFLLKRHASAEEEFLLYMSQLLDTSRRDSSLGLLSPSMSEAEPPMVAGGEFANMETAISFAIQQSNSAMSSKLSANRFEISRSGDRAAVIMLARPAYRLGEIIPVVVDLQESEIPCFSVRATLETSEKVEPTIALRSPASILRVSRKIHATQHESTIFANRVFFPLAIPSNSTPEFVTSGVSLEWRLRFEFVTSKQVDPGGNVHGAMPELLEEVAEDERGTVSVAVETIPCETFEVTVPLRVYGGISEVDDVHVQPLKWFDIG